MKVLILGQGQLGQMLGQASIQLGDECLLVDTRTDRVFPVGAQTPFDWQLTQAVEWADVITWEHEQLSDDYIKLAKAKLLTDPTHIKPLTHRQHEKALFDRLSLSTSPWQAFQTETELALILENSTEPLVIKAAEGGYDGKSQWRWQPGEAIEPILASAGQQPGIAEHKIPFNREVSIVGARTQEGQIYCYPLVENHHRQGILSHTIAQVHEFPTHLQVIAEQYFARLTEALGYIGTFAIEFFVVGEGEQAQLLINEVAPRVHNSGHWTLDGANCSQFSLHMRAITGAPIPPLTGQPTLMINVIGVEGIPGPYWQDAQASPFWYGKEPRIGRKVGHINFALGEAQRSGKAQVLEQIVQQRVEQAAQALQQLS